MQTNSSLTLNSTEQKALELLGANISAEAVAAAIGVTPSYISQLMSQDEFATEVAERRFKSLAAHNQRDNKYDQIEDVLLDRLDQLAPMMYKTGEVLAALRTVNQAQRRGTSAPEHLTNKQPVLQLVMPTKIIQQFTTNINNQVINTGAQQLTTIQSGAVSDLAQKLLGAQNDSNRTTGSQGPGQGTISST